MQTFGEKFVDDADDNIDVDRKLFDISDCDVELRLIPKIYYENVSEVAPSKTNQSLTPNLKMKSKMIHSFIQRFVFN